MGTVRNFGDATNRLSATWRQRRSDLFLGLGGQVVPRIEDGLRVDNRLITPLDYGLHGAYDLSLRRNLVQYKGGGPEAAREQDFSHRFSLLAQRRGISGELYYLVSLEDRDYGGSLVLGRRQVLGAAGGFRTEYDSLGLGYSTEKLRFDSPDSLELSDRDRLIHQVRIEYKRRLREDFVAGIEGAVFLDHLVNLEATRSADNRWNRVFLLRPSVDWLPAPGWSNRASFEVLANYTVYDFESESGGAGIRSTVLRRWSASDTLAIPLGEQWWGEMSLRYDLDDRGRIRWVEFIQERSDERQALYSAVSIGHLMWGRVLFKGGWRIQRQLEDRFDRDLSGGEIRNRTRSYEASGPTLQIETLPHERFRLSISADLLKVRDSRENSRDRLDTVQFVMSHAW